MTKYEILQRKLALLYQASLNAKNAEISAVWHQLYEKLEYQIKQMSIQEALL